jgi:hypothetical protein
MKNCVKRLFLTLCVTISMAYGTAAFAQEPPPPPGSGHLGGGTQPPGGGAPIGEGLLILAALGAGYGAKKIYFAKKHQRAE